MVEDARREATSMGDYRAWILPDLDPAPLFSSHSGSMCLAPAHHCPAQWTPSCSRISGHNAPGPPDGHQCLLTATATATTSPHQAGGCWPLPLGLDCHEPPHPLASFFPPPSLSSPSLLVTVIHLVVFFSFSICSFLFFQSLPCSLSAITAPVTPSGTIPFLRLDCSPHYHCPIQSTANETAPDPTSAGRYRHSTLFCCLAQNHQSQSAQSRNRTLHHTPSPFTPY
jgi:hypothetical protein